MFDWRLINIDPLIFNWSLQPEKKICHYFLDSKKITHYFQDTPCELVFGQKNFPVILQPLYSLDLSSCITQFAEPLNKLSASSVEG